MYYISERGRTVPSDARKFLIDLLFFFLYILYTMHHDYQPQASLFGVFFSSSAVRRSVMKMGVARRIQRQKNTIKQC